MDIMTHLYRYEIWDGIRVHGFYTSIDELEGKFAFLPFDYGEEVRVPIGIRVLETPMEITYRTVINMKFKPKLLARLKKRTDSRLEWLLNENQLN